MKPYYQDSAVTIWHGDCREIAPTLGRFDLLLTDPPYGIGVKPQSVSGGNAKWRGRRDTKNYGHVEWDAKPIEDSLLTACRALARWQIIFGGNYYALPPSACWLVWDKQNGDSYHADCELAWTNLDKAVRRLSFLWHGFRMATPETKWHPTQKPLAVMTWALGQAPDTALTVLDPFAGSGTTGRAAKDLGRKAVLIEREERYCEIAARRMAQEVLPL
jgi:site-specific DNA-methyltransferase (adenine-specific)/modification methylase